MPKKTHTVTWRALANRAPTTGSGKELRSIMLEMVEVIEYLQYFVSIPEQCRGLEESCECDPACSGVVQK